MAGRIGRQRLDLPDLATRNDPAEIVAVDEAIQRMAKDDGNTGAVMRLRFYAGLSVAETAEALEMSERNVRREWSYARARLAQMLEAEPPTKPTTD